jgi:murein DD-endopeptidase MepM/ murein hydrolase activator NlpD
MKMNQQYLILDLVHSIHGRVKRIHITKRALYWALGTVAVLLLTFVGMASSYVRMSWKVSNYNALRNDFEQLRRNYQELQRQSRQQTEQVATLQSLASEVSAAYGLNAPSISTSAEDLALANPLNPTVEKSISEYNFLKSQHYSNLFHSYSRLWQVNTEPSLWPVNGAVSSAFGGRSDPFSGDGEFHTGVDLQSPSGTPVHVTADGVVVKTEYDGGYGNLLVVDHGNGTQTWYGHLSKFKVIPGQEVRRGEVVALSGSSGRTTAAHLHYEVRRGGTPVNPYKYLAKAAVWMPTQPAHSDLGF